MIKRYSYKNEGNNFLSPHFQVKEFASKKGSKLYSDEILIDSHLIEILEDVFSFYNCKYCTVNSGYRTPEHDKEVGGNGKGQHTKGTAADVKFMGQDGKWIDTRYISCFLEDRAVKGIARISEKSIHIDNRSGNRYWGDETVSTRSIWNINGSQSFYEYYGIQRLPAEAPKQEETPVINENPITSPNEPILEEKDKDSVNVLPSEETSENNMEEHNYEEQKEMNNPLLFIIDCIVNFIKRIIEKIKK